MPGYRPLLLLCWLIAAFSHGAQGSPGGRLNVLVSILPQKYFVERVGGEHVQVSVMVGPGQSPATYEPRPRQMVEVQETQLYYRIGVPFENVWMPRIQETLPAMSVLDARQGLNLRRMESAWEGGRDHGHGEVAQWDPHIWLSPTLVRDMAARLRDRLSELDPDNQSDYEANYRMFADDLDDLRRAISARLSGLSNRKFMVFHPSWGYFADEFGLQQIPIEMAGKEPGGRTLAGLIEQARREDIRTIFVQQQFSTTQAEVLARAVGASVVLIDPLAGDYPDNMLKVALAISGGHSK